MLKAVLFDLDGTLLDTAPEFTHCFNQLLSQMNRPLITEQALRHHITFGAKKMVTFACQMQEDHPEFEALTERLLMLYRDNLGTKTDFFPEIAELLTTLKAKQMPYGIVTNRQMAFTTPLIAQFPLLQDLPCVVAGDTLATAKPDPAPLLHACKTLNILPTHCLYVGDAKTDVQASQRAGMQSLVVNYGYIPLDEDPANWQADHYVSSASEILNHLI